MPGRSVAGDSVIVRRRRSRRALVVGCVVMIGAAVAWSLSPVSPRHARASTVTARPVSKVLQSKVPAPVRLAPVCDKAGKAPRHYASVVVFSFENRTWSQVGMGFGRSMPYLHALARQCSYFTDWKNADPRHSTVAENVGHDSVAQYVAQVTGTANPATFDNCHPAPGCSTKANNIFRQARRAGLAAVDYVEGASADCTARNHNTPTHVPALYLWGSSDRYYCSSQIRPLRDFNPDALPAFAFVTPTLCNDGHDCPNSVGDHWAQAHIQPVLRSRAYAAGKVAVFVWYDEDRPVPNLWITPTALPGARHLAGAGYAGTLRAWESMLGLPCLANACAAPNMRTAAHA